MLYRGTGFITDKHSIVTSAHLFSEFFEKTPEGLNYRYKNGSINIFNSTGKNVFRADFLFDEFFSNQDPLLGISASMDWSDVAIRNLAYIPEQDMVVIKIKSGSLEKVIGGPVMPIILDANPPLIGDKLYALGFGASEERLALHANAFIADEKFGFAPSSSWPNTYIRKTMSSIKKQYHGDSGGPLVVFRKDKKMLSVIGLVSASNMGAEGLLEWYTSFKNPIVKELIEKQNILLLPESICN